MTQHESSEDSAWGRIVRTMLESDKSISQIAAEYREKQPEMTEKFRDKTLEEPMITDVLTIFGQRIPPETKLDVDTSYETGEEKYVVYIYLPEEEFDKYYSEDEDRMSKWDDLSERLTQKFKDYGLEEERNKAYVNVKKQSKE